MLVTSIFTSSAAVVASWTFSAEDAVVFVTSIFSRFEPWPDIFVRGTSG